MQAEERRKGQELLQVADQDGQLLPEARVLLLDHPLKRVADDSDQQVKHHDEYDEYEPHEDQLHDNGVVEPVVIVQVELPEHHGERGEHRLPQGLELSQEEQDRRKAQQHDRQDGGRAGCPWRRR